MFTEIVEIGGEAIPRFQFVRELSAAEINDFTKGAL